MVTYGYSEIFLMWNVFFLLSRALVAVGLFDTHVCTQGVTMWAGPI